MFSVLSTYISLKATAHNDLFLSAAVMRQYAFFFLSQKLFVRGKKKTIIENSSAAQNK